MEAIGNGEGGGIEAPVVALAELNDLADESLPVGLYRCMAARADSCYWEHLAIDPDGAIHFAENGAAEDDAVATAVELSFSARTPHHV